MAEVLITLQYNKSNKVDLVLPENIPNQYLAKSICDALRISVPSNYIPTLFDISGAKRRALQSAGTLKTAKVLNGSVLEIDFIQPAQNDFAYLKAANGMMFALNGEKTLGRSGKVDVEIDLSGLDVNRIVSRKHAQIRRRGNLYLIEDLGSANGTWVNKKKIESRKPIQLRDKDKILIGGEEKGILFEFIQT